MNNQAIIETKNYRKPKMPKKKKIAIISSAFAGVICACVAVFFILTGGKTWFFAYEATSDTTCDIKLVGICWDKEIVIPKYIGKYEVTGIGDEAFYECDSLTSIEIPDSVTRIGYSAFSYCSSLTSIEIPNGVTSIGDFAFWACYSLTSITYNGTVSEWNEISKDEYWDSDAGNYNVYCTDGTISKYGTVTYN